MFDDIETKELDTEEEKLQEETEQHPVLFEEPYVDPSRPPLPTVDTTSDEFPPAPRKKNKPTDIFLRSGEVTFFKLDNIFKRHERDYRFFLKFRKYSSVVSFVEQPARAPHMYEKKFWSLSLFDKFCFNLRQNTKHIATAPFSASGDHLSFERETLYSPQKCPAYVAASMMIMEENIQRFAKAMTVKHRDIHDPLETSDMNTDPEYDIKLSRFFKKGKRPRFVEAEVGIPTTKIDRYSWPHPLQPSDSE